MLARHGRIAIVFNAWTRMPGDRRSGPNGGLAHGRLRRRPCVVTMRAGRTENAAKRFEPYRETQEPNPTTREALHDLAESARKAREPAFLFVNNRLEGNAPSTIEAVASGLGG